MDMFKLESVLGCFAIIFQVFLKIKNGINICIYVEEIFKSLKLILLHWKADEVPGREKIIAQSFIFLISSFWNVNINCWLEL